MNFIIAQVTCVCISGLSVAPAMSLSISSLYGAPPSSMKLVAVPIPFNARARASPEFPLSTTRTCGRLVQFGKTSFPDLYEPFHHEKGIPLHILDIVVSRTEDTS